MPKRIDRNKHLERAIKGMGWVDAAIFLQVKAEGLLQEGRANMASRIKSSEKCPHDCVDGEVFVVGGHGYTEPCPKHGS